MKPTPSRLVLFAALALPAAAAGPPDAPPGVLTLPDAVSAALARSPELAAATWDVEAEAGTVGQAGRRPNPELRFEAEDFGGSSGRRGYERAETTLSVAQRLELGGKRQRRRDLAQLDRELASWGRDAVRLEVVARVKKAFVAALAAQERLVLTDELLALAGDTGGATAALVAAGALPPAERTRAEIAHARLAAERGARALARDAAYAALAATWGATATTFNAVAGRLDPLGPPPALDVLTARLAASPQLARWGTERARAAAALAVEESHRIPDLTVRLGSRRFEEDGSAAMVSELSIPLPVFDRNQGAIAAAHARIGRIEAARQAAEAAARAALVAAWQELASAFAQASELQDHGLPAATAALEQTRTAYRQGRLRALDVLDAQRAVFELQGARLDALAAYQTAAAEVERLTAGGGG